MKRSLLTTFIIATSISIGFAQNYTKEEIEAARQILEDADAYEAARAQAAADSVAAAEYAEMETAAKWQALADSIAAAELYSRKVNVWNGVFKSGSGATVTINYSDADRYMNYKILTAAIDDIGSCVDIIEDKALTTNKNVAVCDFKDESGCVLTFTMTGNNKISIEGYKCDGWLNNINCPPIDDTFDRVK